MNDTTRALVLIIMILWVLSPVDACPGPIDDAIVILLGMIIRHGLKETE